MDHTTRKRRRGSDGWDRHRPQIEHLYLEKDLTLKEVMEEMKKSPHNFDKTEQAYKKRLGQWDISKNVPASVISEMLSIAERRRRDQGKETEFYWHGAPVEQDKIRRTQKRLMKGASASAPSTALLKHMRYSTPAPGPTPKHVANEETDDIASPEGQDLDGAYDTNATFDHLKSITATLRATSDIPDAEHLGSILAAQERLVGGYLFFFGNDSKTYLSQCLSLCYFSLYAGTWRNYTAVFRSAVSRVSELVWPSRDVNCLLRLAITFMDSDSCYMEALNLLEFAMDHPDVDLQPLQPSTRLCTIVRSQEMKAWTVAEQHIQLAIRDMRGHPDQWTNEARTWFKNRLRLHDWESAGSKLLFLASTAEEDVDCFFILVGLLLDIGKTSEAVSMITNAASATVEHPQEHSAIIDGVLFTWQRLKAIPGLDSALITIADNILQRAECYREPVEPSHNAEAYKSLRRFRSRYEDDTQEEAQPHLTVEVPSSQNRALSIGSTAMRTRQFKCPVHGCEMNTTGFDKRRDRVLHCLKEHGIMEGNLSPSSAETHAHQSDEAMLEDTMNNPVEAEIMDTSYERGRTSHRTHASSPGHESPTTAMFDLPTKSYDGTGYISPSVLSRDVSPSQPVFSSDSPGDSRRASAVSMTSVIDDRLRMANEARSTAHLGSNDTISVPTSPFRPTSAYAHEWMANSSAQFERRSSAPGIDWSTGGVQQQAVNLTQPAFRRRVTLACGTCKRLKIRCLDFDSHPEHKCSNCVRLHKECNFSPNNPPPIASHDPGLAQLFNYSMTPRRVGTIAELPPDKSNLGPDELFPTCAQDAGSATEVLHATRPPEARSSSLPFTCTFNGCSLRFDTRNSLQRHHRESHG